MRRILTLMCVCLAGTSGAVIAQQSQEEGPAFSGQVFNSPVPQIKVIRPAEEPETVDTGVQPDQADGQTAEGSAEAELPRVIRLGDTPEGEQQDDPAEDNAAQDGDVEDEGRFKRAPKREPTFKPDEQVAAVPLSTPRTRLKNGARLRQLDKMTGLIRTYDVAVGETVRVARLRIRLDACRSPGDNDTHGTMAFLKIWDSKYDDREPEFSGWMFAESPALSALDHPRYDLWVINCTTPLGE